MKTAFEHDYGKHCRHCTHANESKVLVIATLRTTPHHQGHSRLHPIKDHSPDSNIIQALLVVTAPASASMRSSPARVEP